MLLLAKCGKKKLDWDLPVPLQVSQFTETGVPTNEFGSTD